MSGVRFVFSESVLLSAITLDLFSVLIGGAEALLPVFADQILHVGPEGLGVLRAAPAAGAVVASLYLAHRPPFKRAGRTLLFAVAVFALCIIGFGLSRSFGALSRASRDQRRRGQRQRADSIDASAGHSRRNSSSGASRRSTRSSSALRTRSARWSRVSRRGCSVRFPPSCSAAATSLAVVVLLGWRVPRLRKLGRIDELTPQQQAA